MLPEILDIAKKHNLTINQNTLNKKEVQCKCPFCGEDEMPGKQKRFYLSLNTDRQVFRCWFCGEKGGVFRFISLLEHKSENEILAEFRKNSGYRQHPAEKLTLSQLRLIGFDKKPNWGEMRKQNPVMYKNHLNWFWTEWNQFVNEERKLAYGTLFIGTITGKYQQSVDRIKAREREIGASLLNEALKVYSSKVRPKWAKDKERLALELCNQNNPSTVGGQK